MQKVFQGGGVADLHQLLGIADSSAVLYVGDHIYGDILTSKKSMGWRTMLIVPELQMELQHAAACEAAQRELALLRRLRDGRTESIHRLEWALRHPCAPAALPHCRCASSARSGQHSLAPPPGGCSVCVWW